jgi:hypothetical protein
MTTDGGAPIQNEVGVLLTEISTALNTLGDSTADPDPRIAPVVALLSTINGEYLSNPTQAQFDANSLAALINQLLASNPQNSSLSDALEAAEQLAETWTGPNYV